MLQKIILFIILALAIFLALRKYIKIFRRIGAKKKPGSKGEYLPFTDKCYECPENCFIKDELISKTKSNEDTSTHHDSNSQDI